MRKKFEIKGLLLLLPIIILMAGLFIYPLLMTFRNSLFATKFGFGEMEFYRLGNFINLFQDEVFIITLKNTALWTIGNVIIQLTIPLVIALILNNKFKGAFIFRSLILIPWITPIVAVSMMARWLLEPNIGLVSRMLLNIGIIQKPLNLLGSSTLALPTLIIINSWQFMPFGTLLMLAALQTIPKSLYDASKVDGASPWQTFKYITYPLIASMIGFVFFLAFAWNFNSFGLIWTTTQGGPVNSTEILPVSIYRTAFRASNMGESSAISTMIAIFLIVIGFLFFKYVLKEGTSYEG
jgi:multiple sugar transport system permease protein